MNETDQTYLKSGAKPDLLESHPKLKSVGFTILLLKFTERDAILTPQYLLQQYEHNRLVQPAAVSARLLEFDRLADSVLPSSFERLELSPFVHSVRIRS